MYSLKPLLLLTILIASCGYQEPPANTAATEPDPQPTIPVYQPQSTPDEPESTDPIPDPSLWHDPVSGEYWLVGGNGTVDYLMILCIGEYRMATYSEILQAAIHGLKNAQQNNTQIWTSQPAYFDSATGKTYNFYADLSDSAMKTAIGSEIKSLACIWDPSN